MTALDIGVIVVLLLSAGFAFMRGFVRELLAIVAWLGAAAITYYGYMYIVPLAEKFLPKGPFATIAAGAVLFVVALIVLSILTGSVANRVSQTGMSSFDRLFGLIFGLVRGAVLVSLAYIALTWYLPPDKPQPEWLTRSHSGPLLRAGADMLESIIPAKWREQVKTTTAGGFDRGEHGDSGGNDSALRALTAPKPPAAADNPAPSYRSRDRADMDRLINQQQQQPQQGQ
jgi:membrane protein required for colicin V production